MRLMDDARTPLGRWLKVGDEADRELRRWQRAWALGLCAALLAVAALVPSGFFRKQAKLRQAQKLVQRGFMEGHGPLYQAVAQDGVGDPNLALSNPSANLRWSGRHRFADRYALTFSYHAGGKEYRHAWMVDLDDGTIMGTDGP